MLGDAARCRHHGAAAHRGSAAGALRDRPGVRGGGPGHDLGGDDRGPEERDLEYILGARERGDRRVRAIVLENEKPFTPLSIERARGETLRQGGHGGRRMPHRLPQRSASREGPCRPAHHRRRARASAEEGRQGADRQCGLPALPAPLGPRRRLRDRSRQAGRGSPLRRHLRAADQRPRHPAQRRAAATCSRSRPCSAAKATFDTRPIFHCRHPRPRLLLVPRPGACQGTPGPLRKAGFRPEWDRLLRDLDRLQTGVIEKDNTRIAVRTPVTGDVGPAFRAVGVGAPKHRRNPGALTPPGRHPRLVVLRTTGRRIV